MDTFEKQIKLLCSETGERFGDIDAVARWDAEPINTRGFIKNNV